MKRDIRAETSQFLNQQSLSLQKNAAILLAVADSVGRGRTECMDFPRQLRRIAAALEDTAGTIERTPGVNPFCAHTDNFLIHLRNEIHKLKVQLSARMHGCNVTDKEEWPPEFQDRLTEAEDLLELLYRVSGELAHAEYYRMRQGRSCLVAPWRPAGKESRPKAAEPKG